MKTFNVRLPLDDEHLRAIGLVAAYWSFAQHALENVIWALMGVPDDIGRRVTTEVNDMTRISIAQSLAAKRMNEEDYEAFDEALKEYNELRVKRNEVIHNIWLGSEPSPLAPGMKPTAKGPYKTNRNYWTKADILALAEDIEHWGGECTAALHGLIVVPSEEPPPQQAEG